MEITTTKKDLVITIPLWQKSYDAADQLIGNVSNVIGCIEGGKFGFIQVIDLGYKGSFDYGDFIIELSGQMDIKDFKKICKDNDIYLYEYPLCAYCGGAIFGCFTLGDKGNMCSECEYKKEELDSKKKKKK